ncbi:MAG: hypothetical protein JXR83_07335, partial [Deltaproteobacteria bacterium]|nr:hypothetical protein [Deltaproteobacteria bacterium]
LFGLFEQLVERQYVQRAGGQFFFNHATVRDAVYGSTDEDKRRDTHQAIGELLSRGAQGSGEKAGPGQLAYHFKRGRDLDRAIDCFLAAARESMAKKQLFEASMLLGEGADLLEASARADREPLLVTFYDLMAPAGIGAHPPSCLRAASRLLEIWSQHLQPQKVAESIRKRRARAAALPAPLRKLVRPPGPPPPFDPHSKKPELIFDRLLTIKGMQGMAFAILGMPEPAIGAARELVALLPDAHSPLHAVAAVPEVLALFHMGKFRAQRETARRAMRVFEAAGDRLPPPLRIFWFLSTYLYALSEALEGRVLDADIANRAAAIAARFDLPMERGFALLPHMVRAALRGDPESFAARFAALEEITRRLGHPHALASRFLLWLPIYYLEREEIELARATTGKIEGMGKATRDAWLLTYAKVYQGLDALQTGSAEEADKILEQGVALARERKLGRLTTALCARGQALSKLGRSDEARACLDEALQMATSDEQGSIYDETVARRLLADLVDPTAARDHLERSIATATEMENPIQLGMSWFALARLRSASRDGDPRQALAKAAEQFDSIRNRPWSERVAAAGAEIA